MTKTFANVTGRIVITACFSVKSTPRAGIAKLRTKLKFLVINTGTDRQRFRNVTYIAVIPFGDLKFDTNLRLPEPGPPQFPGGPHSGSLIAANDLRSPGRDDKLILIYSSRDICSSSIFLNK